MEITPEVREELLSMLRQEMEQEERRKKENRSVYQRVCKEFETQFSTFNYVETNCMKTPYGLREYENSRVIDWKIRNAIGILLQSAYQVNGVAKLPANKETEMKTFVKDVLSLMQALKNPA